MTLEFRDENGNVINAEELTVSNGDKLVLQVDTSTLRPEAVGRWADVIKKGICNDESLIVIPEHMSVKVVKIQD